MTVRPEFWRGRRVLVTGHTGFNGSWLSFWLQSLAAEVHGYALQPPTDPSLFVACDLVTGMASSTIADVRDEELVLQTLRRVRPEVVFHLAAQPLEQRRAFFIVAGIGQQGCHQGGACCSQGTPRRPDVQR